MAQEILNIVKAMELGAAAAAAKHRFSPPTTTGRSYVLTLDHNNFTDVVSKHDFIVVAFYASWCGYCTALAPEYENAAGILNTSVVFAKVDATEESNRGLASEFRIHGFPTIKILRDGGKTAEEYNGGRDADSIVAFLRRQFGPASKEVNTAEAAASTFLDLRKIYVVAVFNDFSGECFENYMSVAEKMRSSPDYEFAHTTNGKFVPPFGQPVTKPTLRVIKPFDEPFVDSEDFNVSELEKFIEESTVPLVTVWDMNPANFVYLKKFFEISVDKAMLLLNFSEELDEFWEAYNEVARVYNGKGISFLLGDIESTRIIFPYFLLKEEQAPLLIIQTADGEKYLKERIEPDETASWIRDYKGGLVKPYIKSEPVPELSDGHFKVVVRDSLNDVVLKSEKNVLLLFYAPWCEFSKSLALTLEEVAMVFKDDPNVVIAKFDATVNEVPSGKFEVVGFPTVYFRSSTGHLDRYCGDRTKEDITGFIEENRDGKAAQSTPKTGL